MSEAVIVALIGVCGSLLVAVVPKVIDNHYGTGKKIDEISTDVKSLKNDNKMISDITYVMLKHMASNNASGLMQQKLDEYNAYFREN